MIPTPHELGAPAHLREWFPLQLAAMNRLIVSGKRFDAAVLPTGSGKSVLGYGLVKLLSARGLFLSSTHGLTDQYRRDFPDMGDVRGMKNYPCRALGNIAKCDAGPCLDGEACVYKETGCEYFDAIKRATHSQLALSNYDFWFAHPEGLGQVDYLVLDEAHELPAKLAQAAGAAFRESEVNLPEHTELGQWRAWAAINRDETIEMLQEPGLDHAERRDLRSLLARFTRLAAAGTDWAWETESQRGERAVRFEPISPARFGEQLLFRGIGKVLLMSATLRPSTLLDLGIPREESNFFESDSPIPVSRRPIYWMPIGIRINAKTSQTNLEYWVSRQDQVIKPRLGARGIIHTVSYARARFLKQHSRYGEHMIIHTGENTRRIVEQFKQAPLPAILVSPSMHTGWDFAEDAARWQIIAKVPMPDTRTGIAAARQAADPDYGVKHAITTIVQMTGRVARTTQDMGETIIIDDTMRWLWSRYKPYFTMWWRHAFREVEVVPPPPERG